MSITVDDWDDLAEARRRREERAALVYTPPVADSHAYADDEYEPPADEVKPRPVLSAVASQYAADDGYEDDDAFGAPVQKLKIPAYLAGANILAWVAGHLLGVVELVGVAFFASVVLLLASYLLREWQRDRTALICLIGALPLPVTIIGLFYS